MMRNKYKGVTLSATAIAIIAWMFLGYISFIVMASPFSILASARTARQAEQYAEFVASSLKLVDYSELSTASHARQSLTGEIAGAVGWESRVEIGAEQQIGSNPDNLQRIATIDIFQTGDTLSRYTLQVPLSSAGGSNQGKYKIINVGEVVGGDKEYTFDNPYPGYLVHLITELKGSNGMWFNAGWVYGAGNGSHGVKATQLNDDKIVVRTGHIYITSLYAGYPTKQTYPASETKAICRVKVFPLAKK